MRWPYGRKNGMFIMTFRALDALRDYGCLTNEEAHAIYDTLHKAQKRADKQWVESMDVLCEIAKKKETEE